MYIKIYVYIYKYIYIHIFIYIYMILIILTLSNIESGGADASSQNNVADQPSHIAAKENNVVCIYVYIYICICIYTYIYVHVYIHLYIFTYLNEFICIHKQDMLKVLCVYDEHIGRLNYNHQSPVGLARYVHVYVYIHI
jgi:hypothetical protein